MKVGLFQRRQQSSSTVVGGDDCCRKNCKRQKQRSSLVLVIWLIALVVAYNIIGIRNTFEAFLFGENDRDCTDLEQQQQQPAGVVDVDNSPWCPLAVANANPPSKYDRVGCQPCDRRFLILITTGRSASTTLTWMLDTLPGVRMSGENNNLMGHLYDLYEGTLKTLIKKNPERVSVDAWFRNSLTKSSLACAFQNIVETITPPLPIDPMLSPSSMEEKRKEEREMIIGFKTIRVFNEGRRSVEEASKLVNYIVEMFPCTRFVVNVRSDVESQVLSKQKGWNKKGTDELGNSDEARKLKRENVILERIAREILGPDRAIFLDSSEWTKNVTVLNKAVEWLGFSRECFFTELMQFNTGGDRGYGSTKKTLTPHGPGCRYLGGKA